MVPTQVHPEPSQFCFQGFATYLPVVGLVFEEVLFELALRVKRHLPEHGMSQGLNR